MTRPDRSVQREAGQAFNQAGTTAGAYGTAAGDVNATLLPTLKQDVNNPSGFTPTEKNRMLTAGEQSLGGSTAGVVGQQGLNAARTRNTGSTSAIIDQAMRRKAQGLSRNALGVENESARLAQQKRASALGGLERTYGTDVGAQLKAMGIEPADLEARINAGKEGWQQNAMNWISTLTKGAADARAAMAPS